MLPPTAFAEIPALSMANLQQEGRRAGVFSTPRFDRDRAAQSLASNDSTVANQYQCQASAFGAVVAQLLDRSDIGAFVI